ncbi:MAG: hypothetical protein ACREBI_04230 [Nitrosotalea sp.]
MSLTKSKEEFGNDNTNGPSLLHMRDRLVKAIKEQASLGFVWTNIENPAMTYAVLSTYGNALNREILDSCMSEPHTMMEILEITKIPQTTGYRRITSLIKDHFLSAHHTVQRDGAKQVGTYISTFKEITVHISKNQVHVRVKFQDMKNGRDRDSTS